MGKSSVALETMRILDPNHNWMNWLLWFLTISTPNFCDLDCLFGFAMWPSLPTNEAMDSPYLLGHECTVELCDICMRYVSNLLEQSSVPLSIRLIELPTAWNVTVDLVLATLLIHNIWGTSLTLKQRIATCTLLGLGVLLVSHRFLQIKTILVPNPSC